MARLIDEVIGTAGQLAEKNKNRLIVEAQENLGTWVELAVADSDGDQIFSTFDTRDTDKSQPQMNCGTHIITGGTGKYKGITGSEPFACITMPALAGPGGYTAMDIPLTRRGR